MKCWLGVAFGCSGLAIALACAGVLLAPADMAAFSSSPPPARTVAALPAVNNRSPPLALVRSQAVASAYEAEPPAAELDREQVIQLMQMLRDEGDPRNLLLGGLQPRQDATAQELADPKRYQAFEGRRTRELIQAYASGVQQIPGIRARIETAEQGGERSVEEIGEARAALRQLEMVCGKLQRESPQLLPGDSAPISPAAS